MHVAITSLMHELGHFAYQRKQIDRLPSQLHGAAVELADIAELGDDRDQPRARLFRLVDHAALPLAHRRLLILLQHPQVAADDAGGRAELVNGEREQRRIWIRQWVHEVSLPS